MKFAIAGNPNCGKTTLFNALTGSTAKVGNWPGVTVEKKAGVYKKLAEKVSVIDLPGIYSLSPYTPEEVIARDFLIHESPDVVINIVDSTNIERNLYLTTQLMETDVPVVVALNMCDLAKKACIVADPKKLSERLGVPVVEICALRSQGIGELMNVAYKAAKEKGRGHSALDTSPFGPTISEIESLLKEHGQKHAKFRAIKIIEGDFIEKDIPSALVKEINDIRAKAPMSEDFGDDFEAAVANERYKQIESKYAVIVKRPKNSDKLTTSDKADRILTSRLFGLPIFFAMMFFVFHVTFGEDLFFLSAFGILDEGIESPGVWMLGQTEVLMGWISDGAGALLDGSPEWISALIVDGVLAGLGAVLSFLPQILMLFFFLSLMEDTGYMARAAFLMDRVLRRFGLSGKAFMPLLMCFGCLVPAMMGSRTLESERERRLMIMLAPFFSCGAKLPIWAMFAMAIFPGNADFVIFGIYILGIAVAIVAALILKHTILKGAVSAFVMELPPYHMPLAKNVIRNLWEKLRGFVVRATTIIAGATVVIWFLSSFSISVFTGNSDAEIIAAAAVEQQVQTSPANTELPADAEEENPEWSFGIAGINMSIGMVEANSQESILGVVGNEISFVFKPLGWADGEQGWKAIVAALTGLIAKEMVVSTMGVLYNPDVEGDALEDEDAEHALALALSTLFTPLAAISFMAFNLLSVPCMAAVATAHSELRSSKWTWITVSFWITTAWLVSFLIFQIGSLFL